MNDDDDDLLALIDVQRPSSRGGRRRSRVKKKVTFSNDVNANVNAGSARTSTRTSTGRGDFTHRSEHDKYEEKSNAHAPLDKMTKSSVSQQVELKSFSRSSKGGKFGIGSIDELFNDKAGAAAVAIPQKEVEDGMHVHVPSSLEEKSLSKYATQNGERDYRDPMINRRDLEEEKGSRMPLDASSRESAERVVRQDDANARDEGRYSREGERREIPTNHDHRESDNTIPGPRRSSNHTDVFRQESHRAESLQREAANKTNQSQHLLTSQLIDELADKLKDSFEKSQMLATNETKRALVSSINERSDMNTEQLNHMVLKLDGLMQNFKAVVDTDGQRMRNEESRLIKMQEAVVDERRLMTDVLQEERKQLSEERATFEQWRDQMDKELSNRRIEMVRKQEEIEEREHLVEKRKCEFDQKMEHDLFMLEREKEQINERQVNSQEQLEDLKDQRIRVDVQFDEINEERGLLQNMAEQISLMSKRVVEKSKESEEALLKAEQMKRITAENSYALAQSRKETENEWREIENQAVVAKHRKMDLARQRVEFLKERVQHRQQSY